MSSRNYEVMSSEEMELLLWEYLDQSLGKADATAIERLITENREWKARYHELLQVHQMINSSELEEPSMRFTKNVMEEIARHQIAPATKNYINNKIIYGIAGFFITVFVSFIIYGISQVNWRAAATTESPVGIDFADVDYSQIFNNSFVNIFMMMNVILGLMLLDRYLSSKRKEWSA